MAPLEKPRYGDVESARDACWEVSKPVFFMGRIFSDLNHGQRSGSQTWRDVDLF